MPHMLYLFFSLLHFFAECRGPARHSIWALRATARELPATSLVMTEPAPTTAPSPILTGATSEEVRAAKAPAPNHR